MGFKDILLNVVTVGGHGRVQTATAQYESQYRIYDQLYQRAKAIETRTNLHLNRMGEETIAAFKTMQQSMKMLKLAVPADASASAVTQVFQPQQTLQKTQKLIQDYSSSVATFQGATVGVTAAAGSWAMVGILGSASTGTAIATLSGAAATNATLAWFGGGALAAGGGGMAAGVTMIGGIIALPLIVFSAWSAHSKASEIDDQTVTLIHATDQLAPMIPTLEQREQLVKDGFQRVQQAHQDLNAVFRRVKAQLFPSIFSHLWRSIRQIFGYSYYVPQEQPHLASLTEALRDFSALFARPVQTCLSSPVTIAAAIAAPSTIEPVCLIKAPAIHPSAIDPLLTVDDAIDSEDVDSLTDTDHRSPNARAEQAD